MSAAAESYLSYISSIRRYSARTVTIYTSVLNEYEQYCGDVPESLNARCLRNYEVYLMDRRKLDPRTVSLHLSVLSGASSYFVRKGMLSANAVRLVSRPKTSKRLPEFYRREAVSKYLKDSVAAASKENLDFQLCLKPSDPDALMLYNSRLSRLIVSILSGTGIRRAELISLRLKDVDFSRHTLKVLGKGDKMREIPILPSLCDEILLYLKSVEHICYGKRPSDGLLLHTGRGKPLYPVFADRVIKHELVDREGFTGRRSPHVLRHTIATELLDEGADINSIKEMLGHSSLAATQVYTHNSVERLRKVYDSAHPRAKEK